jgi:hypothetical protein
MLLKTYTAKNGGYVTHWYDDVAEDAMGKAYGKSPASAEHNALLAAERTGCKVRKNGKLYAFGCERHLTDDPRD